MYESGWVTETVDWGGGGGGIWSLCEFIILMSRPCYCCSG